MLADNVDPDQIALDQSGQGLHCLPVILLNVCKTLIQKHKVNVQAFPFKGKPKHNSVTLSRCLLVGRMHAFLDVPG